MKKWGLGLLIILGLGGVGCGLATHLLPNLPWLWLTSLSTYWIILVAGGAVLALIALVSLIQLNRRDQSVEASRFEANEVYRADNIDIRSRVRDLLHRAWGRPLLAVLLGALPLILIHVPVHYFLRPFQQLSEAIGNPIRELLGSTTDFRIGWAMLLAGILPDFAPSLNLFLSSILGLIILVFSTILIFQPMRVSRAGYFLRLLYGKKPSPLEVFSCFTSGYLRALSGMAYYLFWLFIWTLLAWAAPIAIYGGGITLINLFPEQLNAHLMILLPSLVGFTIAWWILFVFLWINRWLAYSFTPCVLASQQRLPSRQAVRASRTMMRGKKLRTLGLWLSFLYYFLPAIAAAILLPLVAPLSQVFGFTEFLTLSLQRFFWIVLIVNQLLWFYVLPNAYGSFYAFYLECKREFRENHPDRLRILGVQSRENE